MHVLWKDFVRLAPPEIIGPEFRFDFSVQDDGRVFEASVVSAATLPLNELQVLLPVFTLCTVDESSFHALAASPRTVALFRSSGIPQNMRCLLRSRSCS